MWLASASPKFRERERERDARDEFREQEFLARPTQLQRRPSPAGRDTRERSNRGRRKMLEEDLDASPTSLSRSIFCQHLVVTLRRDPAVAAAATRAISRVTSSDVIRIGGGYCEQLPRARLTRTADVFPARRRRHGERAFGGSSAQTSCGK